MELELSINGVIESLDVAPNESLLTVVRREGYTSVKHGCETGECGACTILVDGVPRPSCVTLAAQVGGCSLTTVESLQSADSLHPLQEAFIDTGAVQCGFCTPGMLLSASALLKRNSSPTEEEVREALAGNLCRCGGYARPVQAVLRAAAIMRGETVAPLSRPIASPAREGQSAAARQTSAAAGTATMTAAQPTSAVGQAERRIDARKLVSGKPTFTDDIEMRDMLYARVLTSPHAHAMIRAIDVSEARALPGVHAVLTYQDVPRVAYSSAGEADLHDQYALDQRVRFVGDRVAVVAAETPELAEQALALIHVDYEVLPSLLDPRLANTPQAPCIHPESESFGIQDATHNLVTHLYAEVGDVEHGFAQAELVVEGEYVVPPVQQAPLETHTALTYWDENERLVVLSNSVLPARVRTILAPLVALPPRRIRVLRPSVGSVSGGKQDVVIEDLCALLTIATSRPVRLEYSRAEEFASRVRHAQIVRMKTGVKRDGTIVANAMSILANTGAYATHSLSVLKDTGAWTLPLYPCPDQRFETQIVYTNLPPAGAFSGSGVPQGCFALESHLDEIARQLGLDALEFRRKNWLKPGDAPQLVGELLHGKAESAQPIENSALPACLRVVEEKLQWKEKRGKGGSGRMRRGVGVALSMYGQGTSGQEMAGASLKLNEDGSFDLLVGAGDETMLAQIAAEVLGARVEDILTHVVDTSVTPFASSTTLASGGGVVKQAAEQVREQILAIAGQLLSCPPQQLALSNGEIRTPGGQSVTLAQVGERALYGEHPRQIMATATCAGKPASPAFIAQGAEVEVDTETGAVRVVKVVTALDAGHIINPVLVGALSEGEAAQALGASLCEELLYDQRGALLTTNLNDYRIFNALDMPHTETTLLENNDPAGIFGAKEYVGVSSSALAPAVANALADAIGTRVRQIPLTPERVLRALRGQAQARPGGK